MTRGSLRLLLVDDDDTYAKLVSHTLRRHSGGPLELTRLKDGMEALDYLLHRPPYEDLSAHPTPHLVLLDERMPKMDGSEVLQRLAESAAPPLPAICLMSSAERERLEALGRCGQASFCITKPPGYDELQKKLHLIIDFWREVLELPPPLEI